ncbi:MAG: hypothetical protein FWC09_07715 [Lachnospiraceae bacterium]|nr:hypothetical protein [Lachnospiraceae bacterium]
MENNLEFELMEGLHLDPSVIRDKHNLSTSLTDYYGIGVFTDSFRQNKERVDNEMANKMQEALRNVFVADFSNIESADIESYLFLQEKEQVISLDSNVTVSAFNAWYALISLGVILLFGMMLYKYHCKKGKEREKNVADIKLDYLTD